MMEYEMMYGGRCGRAARRAAPAVLGDGWQGELSGLGRRIQTGAHYYCWIEYTTVDACSGLGLTVTPRSLR